MMYHIMEEASEAIYAHTDNLEEAIKDAKSRQGKYLVIDNNDTILFDSMPGISFKI